MKAYKLTNERDRTRCLTQWGPGVSHTATGSGSILCSDGWIHFYTHPLIAVLMNPTHAAFVSPNLWECETRGEEIHEPLKSGCKTLTTIQKIPLPVITWIQKAAFGVLCAKEVQPDEKWNQWADNWLSGVDRSKDSAYSAHGYVSGLFNDLKYTSLAHGIFSSSYAAVGTLQYSNNYTWAAQHASDADIKTQKINFGLLAEKALTYQ